MKHEKGFTLIELLGVIVLIGIILSMILSIFSNTFKVTERNSNRQNLQIEANYITEVIRKEYLKHPEDVSNSKFTITNTDNTLFVDGNLISQGYKYKIIPSSIDRKNNAVALQLEISLKDDHYQVITTLSKLK